jgi:hypothetical protein
MCINEEEIAYEIPELEGQDVMEQQENSEWLCKNLKRIVLLQVKKNKEQYIVEMDTIIFLFQPCFKLEVFNDLSFCKTVLCFHCVV